VFGRELKYEEALSELLGLIGERVKVSAGGSHAQPLIAVWAQGVLQRGEPDPWLKQQLAAKDADPGEALAFFVGEVAADGAVFFVNEHFFTAAWHAKDGVVIEQGDVAVWVSPFHPESVARPE
jgi:hypothetical protein